MKQLVVIAIVILVSGFSSGEGVFKVQSDRFVNTLEKNFIGLNLDLLKFYSDASGEYCSNIFKLVDTLVLTAPGYIRITTSNHNNEMKMNGDFYRNFFKFVKDLNSNIILSYENYDSDFELDISEKIIIADEIGLKQIFLEINMANINSTCDEFSEELKILKNTTTSENTTQDIAVKIVISNIQHCLFEKSNEEKRYFLFKIAENSDALIFTESDLESIKGISKNNIPSTLRLLNTEAWTLLQYNDTNDNTEKRFTQSILMIGEATKSGFTRVFEDIEDASNRKSTSEISGLEFFLTIYKLSAGSDIIDVISNTTETDVKVYAQCSEEPDSLFIYAINSGNEIRNLTIDLDLKNDLNKFTEYIITEENGSLNVNGEAYDPKKLDKLITGVESTNPLLVILPPNSVGLWPAVPVNTQICKKFNFHEMDRSIIEEIHEKYPEENKRAKREIGEDDVKMKIENENITDTNEQTQIMILFINPLDNTTVDLTSVYENIEEQYFDEMKHTVTILKHVMQFLKYLYDETEDDDNNQYSEIIFKDTTHPLESNSVHQLFENEVEDAILEKETNKNQKRIPRHVTDNYGEPEPQMEERMSTFGRNIRPPHFSPLDRQKFDHAFKNAKQSMFNLKHGLKPQIPAFTPGLKDLALKDKLLKQKLKTEGFRQKMKMDLKGKFGRLVKRDTEIPSNELSSINTDFPKSCESKTVEIFKTPRSKICTKKLSNDDNAEEPIKGFKRYKYSPIWDKNFNDMSHEDYDSTSIRNDLQKRSYPQEDMEDDNFDLIAEGSSNSWSWENIKCKLGFCEKNQLQEVVDNLTKLYNNLSDKASEIWRTLNN